MLFERMLIIILQRLQRSIQTKEDCLPIITAASPVTSDPNVHSSSLRSRRFKGSFQQELPSVWTTCHIVRTPVRPSIIRLDNVHFHPNPTLCREVSIQLASVLTTQQHVRTPISTRPASDSFQVQIWED
jgi:hypothetical protein